MKKLILSFVILAFAATASYAQTNVSGGIYTNTTWTLTNSPYIVTANVVVFPGVTLTIQPGVVVKFDTLTELEIRQAAFIAQGTATDSITFTANSATPSQGSWNNIYLNQCPDTIKFNYCNFNYAENGFLNSGNNMIIKNSNFNNNHYGFWNCHVVFLDSCNIRNSHYAMRDGRVNNITNCKFLNNQYVSFLTEIYLIKNCTISSNQIGLTSLLSNCVIKDCIIDSNSVVGIDLENSSACDSVINCQFQYNAIGIKIGEGSSFPFEVSCYMKNDFEYNTIGIEIFSTTNNYLYCNKFCNNTSYDMENGSPQNFSIPMNYWCTADSAIIESHIYDGYDNVGLGLVSFMPVDSNCYLNLSCTAYFNLYPDILTPHQYWAVNMASGAIPLIYLWSWGDGTYDTIAYPNHTYSTAGYYNICLTSTDSVGCTSTFCDSTFLSKNTNTMIHVNVIPDIITAINENSDKNMFSIYPNPTTENLTIETPPHSTIEISNIQGQLIKTLTASGTKTNVDVSALPCGVFVVQVKTEKGVAVRKFIKE